ncbi:MFS transporter [Streptomyces umbrinus]|uniref:MFS transporter n=1 Tax=Streptomyces umbrinus TaxID=67370 RepID=UPI00167A825A|nr:MFS transporter [Streptomyces umbrinus]GHB59559.1 MFS transporter [Streptomyces umbrinus]
MTASADLPTDAVTSAPPGKTRGVLPVMCASVMTVQSLVAAINLAIPKLSASSLHPSPTGLLWIVDSYVIVFAALLVPAGALGDRLGRKGALLSGLALFAAGGAVSALAPDVAVLLTGRALAGAGAALLMPASMSLLLHGVPAGRRAAAVAVWGASQPVGGVLGNTGGALILQYLPWRALFWVYVPVAVILLVCAAYVAPRPARTAAGLDVPGSALLVTGSVALLFGIIEGPARGWTSVPGLAAFAAAAVVLTGFVLTELRTGQPVLDPRLFRVREVRSGTVGVAAVFFGMFALFYVHAQFLQYAKGFSPLEAGFGGLPLATGIVVATRLGLRLTDRWGARWTVSTGLLLVAAGLLLLSTATGATPFSLLTAYTLVTALGNGLALPALSHAVVSGLPPHRVGVGSGLNSAAREFGSALGVAVVGTAIATGFSSRLPSAVGAAGTTPAEAFAATARAGNQARAAVAEAFSHAVAVGYRVTAGVLLLLTLVVIAGMRRTHVSKPPTPMPKAGGTSP